MNKQQIEALRKASKFLRDGEPYLTDEELSLAVDEYEKALNVISLLEGYYLASSKLALDFSSLHGIQQARKRFEDKI